MLYVISQCHIVIDGDFNYRCGISYKRADVYLFDNIAFFRFKICCALHMAVTYKHIFKPCVCKT